MADIHVPNNEAELIDRRVIVDIIEKLCRDNERRKSNYGQETTNWGAILDCFILLLSDEEFDASNWRDLFNQDSIKYRCSNRNSKTLFPLLSAYVDTTGNRAKVMEMAENRRVSEYVILREHYIRPFHRRLTRYLKDIFCAVMVNLFDSLHDGIVPMNALRVGRLGREIVDAYERFQSSSYYDHQLWRKKLVPPRRIINVPGNRNDDENSDGDSGYEQ